MTVSSGTVCCSPDSMSLSSTLLVCAHDRNVPGADPVGLLEDALDRAARQFEPRGVAGAAGVGGELEGRRAAPPAT